jgi:hypothetical protein
VKHSTKRRLRSKADKAFPDFPLCKHATGRWAKRVRGKIRYFGGVPGDENGQKALAKWLEVKDDLLAGRTPRATARKGSRLPTFYW